MKNLTNQMKTRLQQQQLPSMCLELCKENTYIPLYSHENTAQYRKYKKMLDLLLTPQTLKSR